MIAGLLFATHDAEDRPATLTATLPFGGVTLIEYQARLLVAAGATQIVVVVARLTPELLGAISRIGKRGVAVDPVRSAVEAAERIHPLARVLMLADGLVTSQAAVSLLAGEGTDLLLVVDEDAGERGVERVGGGLAWAGAARLDAQRIAEVAGLPRDYDFQATLIRVAAQAPAQIVAVPPAVIRAGHGIERHAEGLGRRGRAALVAMVSDRRGWFDRLVAAPLMKLALPALVARRIGGAAIGAVSGVVGLAGLIGIGSGFTVAGLLLALMSSIGLALGAVVCELRDEALAGPLRIASGVLPALAILLLGWHQSAVSADGTARAIAVALVIAGALGERSIQPARRWLVWGSPGAYLVLVALGTLVGLPTLGLALVTLYAAATLAGAIEDLRAQP